MLNLKRLLNLFVKKKPEVIKPSEIERLEMERERILGALYCRRRKRKLAAIDKRLSKLY